MRFKLFKSFGVSYALSSLQMSHLSLKPEQQPSIEAIYMYEGHDVFVWLPKSLCYQALPFLMDSKRGFANTEKRSAVFVVSPLLTLKIDQVKSRCQVQHRHFK